MDKKVVQRKICAEIKKHRLHRMEDVQADAMKLNLTLTEVKKSLPGNHNLQNDTDIKV